ncbi:HEAT repeat domain-containing protein [Enterovibrio baiacu]|uniref:HEAT repeat domain-containing protein n=1 Tax=Enterovibrio baiacu TaxID=2491023 RepID=UPI00101054BD|nr:HEAT repeat domain-containing protein [Enterovibrio baiacu]MBE1276541.1 HEAT repeat domain-containing protein [Enterovibrio baiacu]
MRKTLGLLMLPLSAVLLLEFYVFGDNDAALEAPLKKEVIVVSPKYQSDNNQERQNSLDTTDASVLKGDSKTHAYQAVIVSTLSSENKELAHFTNTLKFVLHQDKKHTDQEDMPLKGAVYNAKFESENPETDLPAVMGFTYSYNNGAFHNVSLLGLQPEHPLNIVSVLLQQLSYYPEAHTIDLPDGKRTYAYTVKDDKVFRSLIREQPTSTSYSTLSQSDSWLLNIDVSGFPVQLDNRVSKNVVMDNQPLKLEQSITVTPIGTKNDVLLLANYSVNANTGYAVSFNRQESDVVIQTPEDFMSTLVVFDRNPTLDTAEILGVYAAEQGLGFVRELMFAEDVTDSMRSNIIFSLERSGLAEGEFILSALIEDESLEETDRIRAMMSMVKMGDVNSTRALTTLESMVTDGNPVLAQTAMLNIGILGKQNERLTPQVTAFLSEALSSRKDAYISLLAANNLGSNALDAKVTPYLSSTFSDERQLAAKLLSKNPVMRPQLMTQMLNDSHPSVVRAIATGLEGASVALTESYQAKLRHRIEDADVLAPTRDLLFEFLVGHTDESAMNAALARRVIEMEGVSESTLEVANQYLAGKP